MTDLPQARFLARASQLFGDGDWVFTGFHWPVLAMATARRLRGAAFAAVFEAGAALVGDSRRLPTSTTDYAAYDGTASWFGSSADALLAMARRYDRVVLDAGNVDVRGAVNATALGPAARPTVRLAGGGGAADAAAGARELVLLHGRTDAARLVAHVDHVTARTDAPCRLVAPWGTLRLGTTPAVEEWLGEEPPDDVRRQLDALGVAISSPPVRTVADDEVAAARDVLAEAAQVGYAVARAARSHEGDPA
jgi:glutaconate CoA-transferase, subunit B